MEPTVDIERAVRASSTRTSPELDEEILRKVGLELDAAVGASRLRCSTRRGWLTGAVHSKPLKLATAAVALLGLVLGAELVSVLHAGGVVWAEVADRMARMDRFLFRLSISIVGDTGSGGAQGSVDAAGRDAAMAFYYSSSLGFRWDVFTERRLAASYIFPQGSAAGIAINYDEETWSRVPASAVAEEASAASPVGDPEAYVRRLLERRHTELGRSTIDGIEVEGIEVIDPPTRFGPGTDRGPEMEGIGRLWVGLESGLPMRIELEQRAEQQRVKWTLDFRWGSQVDAAAFSPSIPGGFSEGH